MRCSICVTEYIKDCVVLVLHNHPSFSAFSLSDIQFLLSMDFAKGHVAALDYAVSHKGAEIFNLGTGYGFSVKELVDAFIRVNGVDVPYVIAARRDGDIAECYADVSKAKKVLDWKAEKGIDEMCGIHDAGRKDWLKN